MENSEWLDLFESKVEKNLLNDLVKAETEFATKTRSLKLIEPLDLQSEENKSDSLQLIAKMTDFAKEANLDVETIMQEQCNDTVMIDIKNCLKQNEKPEKKQKKNFIAKKKDQKLISGNLNYYSLKTNVIGNNTETKKYILALD